MTVLHSLKIALLPIRFSSSAEKSQPARRFPLLWLAACGLFLLAPLSKAQCPADLDLTTWTGAPLYQVTGSITAEISFTISGAASVTFAAGTVIKLENGFRASA